jgi:hypothetical protein
LATNGGKNQDPPTNEHDCGNPKIRIICNWVTHAWKVTINRLKSIESLILTTATVFLGLMAYWQWSALDKTDITLNKTLIATNLPWVAVAIDPAGPIIWRDGGLEVSYKITLKNIGKSPALKVSHIEGIILDRDANLAIQQQDLGIFLNGAHPLSGLANIMPGDDRQMICHEQVNRREVEKARKPWAGIGPDLITPVLIGIIHYMTQFDTEVRQTGFIYEIGFWDQAQGFTHTALDPASDGDIPFERVRIRRHPQVDGRVD